MIGGRLRTTTGFVPWAVTAVGGEYVHGNASLLYKFLKVRRDPRVHRTIFDGPRRTTFARARCTRGHRAMGRSGRRWWGLARVCGDDRVEKWRRRDVLLWIDGSVGGCAAVRAGVTCPRFRSTRSTRPSGRTLCTPTMCSTRSTLRLWGARPRAAADGVRQIDPNERMTLREYLESKNVSERGIALAEAGYANTLCSSIDYITMKELVELQQVWTAIEGDYDFRVEASFQAVLDKLLEGVRDDVQLGSPVASVKYCQEAVPGVVCDRGAGRSGCVVTTTGGEVFRSRKVVLTVPVTVIRDGDITFEPPLPANKVAAARAIVRS